MGDLCPAPPGNRPPLGGPVHRTAPHHDAIPNSLQLPLGISGSDMEVSSGANNTNKNPRHSHIWKS